jgi:hypothetical protein
MEVVVQMLQEVVEIMGILGVEVLGRIRKIVKNNVPCLT